MLPERERNAMALFDFNSSTPGHLSLTRGDVFVCTSELIPGNGWFTGKTEQGKVGIFPANHVELEPIPHPRLWCVTPLCLSRTFTRELCCQHISA